MVNITRDDSRRIVEKYATTAKNSCKILEGAVNARKLDKTVSKQFIASALSPLVTEVEKYKGLNLSETYNSNLTQSSKTHVKQTLSQLEKDLVFLKEEYKEHMDLLESFTDSIGTVQVNRAITAPMLYLTYMGSSGKDKMTYKATSTKLIKNPTKVRFYEIDGEVYEAPACFKDPAVMAKVIGSYTRNGLTKVDLTSADYVNGKFKFKTYGEAAINATTGVVTYTEGTDVVDKELYNTAEIKYLEFKDATDAKFIVEAGRDVTGTNLFMTQMNKGRVKVELKNPKTNVAGVLHVDFLVDQSAVQIVVSPEAKLTGIIIDIKTGMFNPGLQKPITSFVKTDVIEREINESLVQEFVYNEETKMLWHDIANIDITAEALVGFHEMTVNAKDSYIYADIHSTLDGLKRMYSAVAGQNAIKSSAPMSGLVDGFVATALDFKATTDGTRFYQERQPAKFERLAEMMSYAHLKFQQITQANSIYTNWGTNKSVAMWLTKQEANLNTDEVVAGVRPLNTIYHFEQGGNPMKVVVTEREAGWEMGQESVEINGFPVFMDENIENKAFYQFWTFVQDGESKIDYRSMSNPYQKPIINIDNFGIVSYQAMASTIQLKNIQI